MQKMHWVALTAEVKKFGEWMMQNYMEAGEMRALSIEEVNEVAGGIGPMAVAILVAGGFYIYWTVSQYEF